MTKPAVSVVMSVYNGAKYLRESVDSVLVQEGVDFEFIIVNDGSTDATGKILAGYAARDDRIRLIEQENQGLTRALIRGCKEARGKYIARQDAGDISLIGRLLKQINLFQKNPDAVLVSCGTRFVGPEREHLYDVIQSNEGAVERLCSLTPKNIQGPSHHGSTMFRRSAYKKVGGYRSQFYFAQDLDLWVRLIEIGKYIVMPELLFKARVTPSDVSRRYRKEQIKLTKYLLECKHLRLADLSEDHILSKAAKIRPYSNERPNRLIQARAFYFIGACLKQKGNVKARKYFKQAIKHNPFHFRSWFRLLFGDHS